MSVHHKRKPAVYVGIDWADEEHAFHLEAANGNSSSGTIKQQPRAIDQWVAQLRLQFPGHKLLVVLEQSKGALMAALMKHDDLVLFPINPGQLAKYRESMNYSGCKDDPTDAELLAQFLMNYQNRLRPLQPDTPETRKLAILVQDRRRLVDQRIQLANRLTAILKQYYPLLIELKAAKPYARFLCELLIKWPTLTHLKRARSSTIRKFFQQLNLRFKVDARLELIRLAVPLTTDEVLIECYSRRAVGLARQILLLSDAIADYDTLIASTVESHEERPIFASLPGAATLTQSRMIAALGTRRERFKDCQSFQACTGIAPVLRKSGKSQVVHHRWACHKFVKQTFHEYAGHSIGYSKWAKAYYELQLARGKKPNTAKRALAFKWQRIIYRCWQERTPYDEERYLARLKATGSPLLSYLKP